MKDIKRIWIGRLAFAVVAIAIVASSCQKEEILDIAKPFPAGEFISFNIERGWEPDQITRSGENDYGKHKADYILTSEDNSQSINMGAYQQPIDTWFEEQTRGTMIQGDAFNEFMAFGYKTNGSTTEQMFNTYHTKAGGMWEKPVGATGSGNENGFPWPGAEYTCSFFGIAMSDNKLTNESFYNNVTTTTNDAGQIISFDYTVPDAAVDQPDVMVASATNLAGDGSQGATLAFNHILTAINIKVGNATVGSDITGITINSITFNNIYAKAAYTIATNSWTNTAFYDTKKSFKVDFNGAAADEGTYNYQSGSGAIMNGTAATLMMIPQTLRNDATVTVEYTLTGDGIQNRPVTSTANIGGSVWEAGKAINYILNIDNSDGVEFLTQDSYQDAHFIILPLNIKYQNPGGTVTLKAVDPTTKESVNWVEFRSNLVEVENDGWWADPTQVYNVDSDGNQTAVTTNNPYARSESLTVTAAGQYFAFITENIGDSNREVELQLLINNVLKDNISITQLCPTWNGDGTKGCERIEEGEPLPWGYSWKLNDGEEKYEVVRKTDGILNTIFSNIVNWLYGGAATHPGGGNWWNTDYTRFVFDYTDFINTMSDATSGAGSTNDGLQNSIYMFNYSASGTMLGFYEYLLQNGGNEESATFTGISYTEYATKEALKKNKVKVLIGSSGGSTEHNPVIESSMTDLWYLPATGEVSVLQNNTNMISGVETAMNAGDIFWTSTAAATPDAYSYTFGGTTQTEDRDNPHRVRAIRAKATTN